jgi:hypothetical protein
MSAEAYALAPCCGQYSNAAEFDKQVPAGALYDMAAKAKSLDH